MEFIKFIFSVIFIFAVCFSLFVFLDPVGKNADKKNIFKPNSSGQCSEIIMYSASWCGYCKIKREQMRQAKVSFTEYQLDKDISAEKIFLQKIKRSGLQQYGYPTFEINGTLIGNYDLSYLLQKTCGK